MTLTKKKKRGSYFWRLLGELIVVFAGVFMAFMINSYREDQLLEQEKQKVLNGLLVELRSAQEVLPKQIKWQAHFCDSLKSRIDREIIPGELSSYRFLQPQYPMHLLDYSLTLKGSEIIDQELFIALSGLSSNAQRMRHAEELINEVSLAYRPVTSGLLPEEAYQRGSENLYLARRFYEFSVDRLNNMRLLEKQVAEVIALLEARKPPAEEG